MIDREKLAKTVRELDEKVDNGATLPQIFAEFTLSEEDTIYVASQRALRAFMVVVKGMRPPFAAERFKVTDEEEKLLNALTSVWLDGMLAGLTLAKEEQEKS